MRTGLRTEIILSISLLLAAALLFAGFLLVKLTERNLLDQQRVHAASIIRLIVAGINGTAHLASVGNELKPAVASLNRLQMILGRQADIVAWRLLDAKQQVLTSTTYEATKEFSSIALSSLARDDLHEELVYQSLQFFRNPEEQSYLDLSTPLKVGNDAYGLLQIRFSLEGLQKRVQRSQRLMFLYVIAYGLVLAVFSVYLLNRNIVRPVRELHQATATVARGTLTSVIVPSGPGEIRDLATSFNQMVAALTESRAETERHIESLEDTNLALAQARDDLVRSEKLATVGHLAAGMAHEIGNPLGAVIGYLNILKEDLTGDSHDLVERSLVETGRIDRLIRELLEYSAPIDRQTETFCPIALLRETLEMLRHQGQLASVEIDDQFVVAGCLVTMDRDGLMQVWINLLLNAQDAMQGKGHIKLSSRQDKSTIRISVLDDGDGIDPQVVRQVFEPFFTTKAPGSGYGLGLAVCQRIIDGSDGSIEVTSGNDQGTCFTVTLPCSSQEIS